jgi:hypothetical protein
VRTQRFLAVSLTAAFVMMLLFAVAVGAQVQVQQVQQQQVPDNQQQILEVQQQQQEPSDQQQAAEVQQQQVLASQQGLVFAEGKQSDGVQVAAESGALRGEEVETRSTDNDRRIEVIRVPFPNDCKMTKNKVSFVLEDDDGTQADFIEGNNVRVNRDGDVLKLTSNSSTNNDIVPLNERGGDRQLDNGGLTVATSTGIECASDNDGGNDGGDGGGDGGDGGDGDGNPTNPTNPVTPAQDTTTPTTTSDLNTASPAETTAADANALNADVNRPDAENFRCDLFLRVVRDDRGALRDQYQGDELIVQRFEQCLSEEVLADTFPDRDLPFTGGMSLLFLAAIGLAAIVAGVSVLWAVTRLRG